MDRILLGEHHIAVAKEDILEADTLDFGYRRPDFDYIWPAEVDIPVADTLGADNLVVGIARTEGEILFLEHMAHTLAVDTGTMPGADILAVESLVFRLSVSGSTRFGKK